MLLWEAVLLLLCGTHAAAAKIPKDVVAHVACEVCGYAMREVFNKSREQGATHEDDLAVIVDRLCSVTKGTSEWLLQLDITRPVSNGPLQLRKHEDRGRCRKECSIVQRACAVSLDGQEETLMRRLQNSETSAPQLEKDACRHVCKAKLPALSNWKDEAFQAKRGLDADELAEYKHRLGIKGDVKSFGPGGTDQLDMESVPEATKRRLQDALRKPDKSAGGAGEVSMNDVPQDVQQKLKSAMAWGSDSSFGFGGMFGGKQKEQLDPASLPSSLKQSLTDALEGPKTPIKISIDDGDLLDEASQPPAPKGEWDGNQWVNFRPQVPMERFFEGYCKHVGIRREGVRFSFRGHAVLSGEKSLSDYGIGANDAIHVSVAAGDTGMPSSDAQEEREEL